MPTTYRCTFLLFLFLFLPMSSQGEVIDWPLATEDSHGDSIPGYRTYIQQKFAFEQPDEGLRPHAGIDLQYRDPNGGDPGLYSRGKAVYVAAAGRVVFADPDAVHYPGDVVVIEHRDSSGKPFYTQYGHLSNVTAAEDSFVERGTQIGEIYDDGDNSHLHFEIRDFLIHPTDQNEWGPGYGDLGTDPRDDGWFDPVDYYYTHRRACSGLALHDSDYTLKIRDRPTFTGQLLGEFPIGTQIQVEDVVPDSEDNGYWWFKVAYQAKGELRFGFAGAHAELSAQDALINLAQVPRSCEHLLPGITHQANNWDTRLFIRNNNPKAVNALVKIFENNGVRKFRRYYYLQPNGSVEVTPDVTIQEGTAVVLVLGDSEATEGLSVVARNQVHQAHGDAFAGFEAVRYASSKQTVPVVHRGNHAWYNDIFLFNPSSDQSLTVELDFSDVYGNSQCDEEPTIGPRETLVVDTATWDGNCMSDGYVGTLTLLSRDGNGDPAPLAVTTRQEMRLSNGIIRSLAVSGITRSASTLYMPLIHNQNWDYEAGVGVALNGGNGSVTAIYRPAAGGFDGCVEEPLLGWPVIEALLPTADQEDCPRVISTVLRGSANAQLFAQFNQLFRDRPPTHPEPNADTTSVPAESHPNYRAFVPYLQNGALRGIQIQNTGEDGTFVTVRYYDPQGQQLNLGTYWVNAYGVQTLVGEIPPSASNAMISSSRSPIAVVVNNVMDTGARDDLMDYLAPLSFD